MLVKSLVLALEDRQGNDTSLEDGERCSRYRGAGRHVSVRRPSSSGYLPAGLLPPGLHSSRYIQQQTG